MHCVKWDQLISGFFTECFTQVYLHSPVALWCIRSHCIVERFGFLKRDHKTWTCLFWSLFYCAHKYCLIFLYECHNYVMKGLVFELKNILSSHYVVYHMGVWGSCMGVFCWDFVSITVVLKWYHTLSMKLCNDTHLKSIQTVRHNDGNYGGPYSDLWKNHFIRFLT